MGKANHKNRAKHPRIVAMREDIYLSEAWKSLRPVAKLIYLELRRRFKMNPNKGNNNNGEIGLSQTEAANECRAAINTVRAAFKDLEDAGLIKMNNKGYFGNGFSSTYILTCETFGTKAATNEWRNYRPPEK